MRGIDPRGPKCEDLETVLTVGLVHDTEGRTRVAST